MGSLKNSKICLNKEKTDKIDRYTKKISHHNTALLLIKHFPSSKIAGLVDVAFRSTGLRRR